MNEGERFWMCSISCQFWNCFNWKTVRSEPTFMDYQGGGEGEYARCTVDTNVKKEKSERQILQNLAKCLCKVNA